MTDRELLELAAKAAGYVITSFAGNVPCVLKPPRTLAVEWQPLTDDGDALLLAVKLNFSVHIGTASVRVMYPNWVETLIGRMCCDGWTEERHFDGSQAKDAATRSAIVRAAAAMAPKETT